jgi:hypothetical protein
MQRFENAVVQLEHPANWRAYGQGSAFSLAPDNGIVSDRSGNNMVAYGVIGSVFEPHQDRSGSLSLEEATDQLVDELRRSNPNLRVVRTHERDRVAGQPALSTELRNQSPVSGSETDWLVTVLRPEGLVYFVFVAPQSDYRDYQRSFEQILESIRFKGMS